jgi:acetolactate synthase-1/3 small subunit
LFPALALASTSKNASNIKMVPVSPSAALAPRTGSSSKLDAYIESIDKAAILETVRTGASGIGRGDRILKV